MFSERSYCHQPECMRDEKYGAYEEVTKKTVIQTAEEEAALWHNLNKRLNNILWLAETVKKEWKAGEQTFDLFRHVSSLEDEVENLYNAMEEWADMDDWLHCFCHPDSIIVDDMTMTPEDIETMINDVRDDEIYRIKHQ